MTKALVILCGGKSSRMGSDKAFLPFGEDSLLNYQIKRFRPYFSRIYLSIQDKADKDIDYEAYCGCPEITDLYPGIGPMGGLYSCLCKIPEDIVYFHAVDTPFSSPELAVKLCEDLEIHTEAAIALFKNPRGEVQPLQGAYTKKCLPVMQAKIQERRYALRGLLDEVAPYIHEAFHREEQFFNMNDPYSYYDGLRRLAEKQPGSFPVQFRQAQKESKIPVLSFTAKSGTGKTTYLEKLLPILKARGLRIAVLKHDAHGFTMDKPGKDSYRLTKAGADHMILTSAEQTAAIFTHPKENPDLSFLLSQVDHVDLILTEGYKLSGLPKVELLRKGYNETLRSNPEQLMAVVCDFPFETELPVFPLNEPEAMADFIIKEIVWKQK